MIKVKGYRVLIKPDIVDLTTPSGIVIASDKKIEQSGQQYGTIVQIGADIDLFNPHFSPE